MRSLTYISGPPCSGKSIACKSALEVFPQLTYVRGDEYWLQNEGMSFSERVTKTNKMILQDLPRMEQCHLLLEWVPLGKFYDNLQDLCRPANRSFNHIVLYAEAKELQKRKMARDGDNDVVEPDITCYKQLDDALVLDTTQMTESDVQAICVEWLRARL